MKANRKLYFSGLIFCGDCGSPLIRNNKFSSHIEYLCKGYTKKSGCSSHKILEDELEGLIKANINNMVHRLCDYGELASRLKDVAVSKEEAIIQNDEISELFYMVLGESRGSVKKKLDRYEK